MQPKHQLSRRSLLLAMPVVRLAAQTNPPPSGPSQSSPAQSSPAQSSPPQGRPTTFSTDVRVVNVLATVRNKQGQIVNTLSQDDFLLTEDGRPQTIKYFARDTDLPLTLGLLVDTSLSQRRVIGQERTASYQFLDDVLRPEKDQAFVIHFDREVELLQDLTNSREKLEKACNLLEVNGQGGGYSGGSGGGGYPGGGGGYPGGGGRYPGARGGGRGTLLYDAALLASDELMSKQKGRKAVIVLSDGVDRGSRESLGQAIESAQRADTLVYSIYFADTEEYPLAPPGGFGGYGRRRGGFGGGGPQRYPQAARVDGKKILEQLSRETGGGFFEVSKKDTIDKIYSRIQQELRNQYSLGYTSDQTAGGGYRKISLTTNQKGLVVQTREGYYASGQ